MIFVAKLLFMSILWCKIWCLFGEANVKIFSSFLSNETLLFPIYSACSASKDYTNCNKDLLMLTLWGTLLNSTKEAFPCCHLA